MREFVKKANAKCRPGTEVLKRQPRREWAGDMPKTDVPKRTAHGADRMRERGISDQQAADAIINPLATNPVVLDERGRPSQKHIGREATVAVNPETQQIVTAYRTSSRIRRRYDA